MRRYTLEGARLIYWGIGTHVGQAVSQNGDGDLIGDIKVVEAVLGDPHKRGYTKPGRASFHTDTCDTVGLMCWRKAKRGGEIFVASAMTAHNLMLEERPDLLAELYEPYCHDIKNEEQPGRLPYYTLPVFSWMDGLVSTRYSRSRIMSGQRFEDVPRITERQAEAFDFLDSVMAREGVALAMDFQVGDIQLVNNYVCFHSRNAYERTTSSNPNAATCSACGSPNTAAASFLTRSSTFFMATSSPTPPAAESLRFPDDW